MLPYFKIASNKNYFYKKQKQKTEPLRRKNGYLYVTFCQKYFSKSKSYSLNAAHEQKTLRASKKLVQTAFLLTFAFRSKQRLNK